jgi:serine/threonine protein kinase
LTRSTCCTMNGGDPMSEKSKKLRLTNSIDRRRLCLLSTKPTSTFVDSRGNGIKFRPLSSNAERRDRERKGSMLLKKLVADLVEKREEERERKRAFLRNGGLVLEKLVASCNGRPIPIRTFSYQQLLLATNNFDPPLILDNAGDYKMYKGSFEGRILSIKNWKKGYMSFVRENGRPYFLYNYEGYSHKSMDEALTDLGISAKTSGHKNILQLVGCCLETSIPASVYEFAQNGVLADRIYISQRQGTPMVWQNRLKIARQIAHAISYLHTAFSRPIIHRDIQPANIFLDQHDVPKLANFELSISIPEGETHVSVDHIRGNGRFSCPIYMMQGMVTEKIDVYSFGVVLFDILTGQCLIDLDRANEYQNLVHHIRNLVINDIVDPAILAEEGGAGVEQQLQAILQLVLTCVEYDPEIRPTMVDVTKELRRIERSIT